MTTFGLSGLTRLCEALERLGIRFYVTGGLASSVHGEPRFTEDIDLVAELEPSIVSKLKGDLGADFEVDEESLSEAARTYRSDNVFFLPDFTRFDIYCVRPTPLVHAQLERRVFAELPGAGRVPFATAEDTILNKLEWYRRGGEVSQKQWTDVLGILRTRAGGLDSTYLSHWAAWLDLRALLDRAVLAAAGLG